MESEYYKPINIGSDQVISIKELTAMTIAISRKDLNIRPTKTGPVGVLARSSDNDKIFKELAWEPLIKLEEGMETLYNWILKQIKE